MADRVLIRISSEDLGSLNTTVRGQDHAVAREI